MPNDGRDDLDLNREAKRLRGWRDRFKGVYSKDQLPRLRNNETAIVNLQNSEDSNGKPLPGTHWVSTGVHNNKPWYFDSYGTGVPLEVSKALGAPEQSVVHFANQVQADDSNYCGDFALAAAHQVAKNPTKAPSQAIKSLIGRFNHRNLKSNDRHVERILKTSSSSSSGKGSRNSAGKRPFYIRMSRFCTSVKG